MVYSPSRLRVLLGCGFPITFYLKGVADLDVVPTGKSSISNDDPINDRAQCLPCERRAALPHLSAKFRFGQGRISENFVCLGCLLALISPYIKSTDRILVVVQPTGIAVNHLLSKVRECANVLYLKLISERFSQEKLLTK